MILTHDQDQNRTRLIRYMARRVGSADFCAHEFAARCKRGIDACERLRRLPIPRHRALVVITERFDIRRAG